MLIRAALDQPEPAGARGDRRPPVAGCPYPRRAGIRVAPHAPRAGWAAARRLHSMAGGNPFFALELGPAFDRHRADVVAGAAPPVPDRLRDLIADRVERLPAVTRAALAAAAAVARPTPALLERAGMVADSLRPAFAARIV